MPGRRLREPRLRPRDDGPRRADFVEFRRRLQDAVTRKDTEALLSFVDGNVKLGFDGADGIERFKDQLNSPEENLWGELAGILALGGTFRTPTAFDSPYTFSEWPDELDPFECVAVTGTGVRLRKAPRLDAGTWAHLDFHIVQRVPGGTDIPGWERVRLASGRTGYIASQYVRSPIARRALFEFRDGRWWLMAFVAGD